MSVHVSSWAWKQRLGDPGLKLVLIKLADNADDDGYSWWGQARLADECEISRPTVQRKLKVLEERGFIEVIERKRDDGGRAANGYRIRRPLPQSEAAPPASPDDAAPASSSDAAPASTVRQQEPSLEPSGQPSEGPPVDPPLFALGMGSPPDVPKKVATVNRKKVTDAEYDFAVKVLAEFNRVAGTSFGSGEFLGKIIMRHREFPTFTVDMHREVIERNFAAPWWKAAATPSVIYGSEGQFESSIQVTGERIPLTRGERQAEAIRKLQSFREEHPEGGEP